ncbi:hypothetical protein [Bradyrhizobium sp. UFLA05-112]
MRKVLVFALAIVMLLGGLYVAGLQLFFSSKIYLWFVIGGVTVATVGAHLLWTDILAPMLNIQAKD